MLAALLCLLSLGVGIMIGLIVGHPGPFWPLKTGVRSTLPKVEADGFVFDSAGIASITDEEWTRLKGNPNAVRRYIDERAYRSEKLVSVRQGILAARAKALKYYAEGNNIQAVWAEQAANELESEAKALESSLSK